VRGREDLVRALVDRGFLANPSVERAFRSVDLVKFLPADLEVLAVANAPIPYSETFRGAVLPSPAALAALLQLMDPQPGLDIGIVGGAAGYPAALLAIAAEGARVSLAEVDGALRGIAERNLVEAGLGDRVVVSADLPAGPFARILVLDPGQRPMSDLRRRLADPGFLIARSPMPERLAFEKRIKSGGEELELSITDMPAGPQAGKARGEATWSRLLIRDALLEHAWEGRVVGHHDAHFAEGIDDTFDDGPLDPEKGALTVRGTAARRAFHAAYILQSLGELDDAEDLYLRSLALFPTSEGHTFLGWTYSFMGDPERAIAECKRAIETDPSFGNPFNDIGAYLLELAKPADAIPWLKQALESTRYCCYFYAHTNLARAYALQGKTVLARRHLEEALKLNPGYEPAAEMLRKLGRGTDYVA
jgi:protein-L-isoaspartate O-methyltransferase